MIYVGKRRTSIARAYYKSGSGKIFINNQPVEKYNPSYVRDFILEPLFILGDSYKDELKKIDIFIKVIGGGKISQGAAARTAIGKLLVDYLKSDEVKKLLGDYDKHILVSDVRQREPRKPWGHGKARGKRQKSYR